MVNDKTLDSFIRYCKENPNQRFWQALRNWAGVGFIMAGKDPNNIEDTFYWKGINPKKEIK